MPKIISNTSCLIILDNINALYILQKLYQNIYLTGEVAQEYGKPLENWMNGKYSPPPLKKGEVKGIYLKNLP